MRYKCNECGCSFYYFLSYTFETIKCPQCGSKDVESCNYRNAATSG